MTRADVVIIGAGVMGCSVAWRLRRCGLSVILVERGIPGAEASSAAAGILSPQAEAEGPGPFLELGLRSRALYRGFVEELRAETGIDVGYRDEGTLVLAGLGGGAAELSRLRELEALRERAAWQRALGLAVRLLDAAELRALEPALGAAAGALHLPDDHQVEAPLLSRALAQAAAQAGARFHSAHVQRVLVQPGSPGAAPRAVGVEVEGTRLLADHVVVAAGSWSALLGLEGALPPQGVRPMRGQMLELDTRPPVLRHVVFAHAALPQGGQVAGYLVPRRDGRLVAGSTMELVGFRKEVTVEGLSRLLGLVQAVAPPLAEAEVRRTWAGFRPYTADALPLLGPTPIAGLHLCTGHFRNGILLTPISAEAMVATVTGRWRVPEVDLRPFLVERVIRGSGSGSSTDQRA